MVEMIVLMCVFAGPATTDLECEKYEGVFMDVGKAHTALSLLKEEKPDAFVKDLVIRKKATPYKIVPGDQQA